MKLIVKRKISNTCLLLTLVVNALCMLPLTAVAAEDNDFNNDVDNDRNDARNVQRAVLQENGVNNFAAPQPRVSRGQAMNIASSRYEGRVLSIRMDDSTNNWRVRMDREGTVFNVFVNASSGAVNASAD